ncbi:MAG: glycosyltransferase [bacterium]|nr:glycosyltransferase [bacterium]
MAMCQALADNGHRVTLLGQHPKNRISRTDPHIFYGTKRTFNVIPLSVPRIPFGFFLYQLSILWYLWRVKPDLVYGRFLEGCLLATRFKYLTIYEAHIPVWHKNDQQEALFLRLIRQPSFKRLVVISQALKTLYTERYPELADSTFVAHDGADIPKTTEAHTDWPGRRGHLQIGIVGHLYKGRGVELMLEIAKALSGVDVHFIGGTEKDINHWKNKVNLPNIFFHGFIEPAQLSPYINALDVGLMPYQKKVRIHGRESLNTSEFMSPLKLFQYMAHKKTIIASDLPVIREVVDEKSAILVPHNDTNEWIGAVSSLENKEKRSNLAKQAHDIFLQKYTWQKRARLALDQVQ